MGWPFTGKDGLIEKVYLPMFQEQGEKILPSFCKMTIPKMAFLSAYKTLPPIEEMNEKEKYEMKQYVNSLFKGETPQFRLDACKIIYTIGNLI